MAPLRVALVADALLGTMGGVRRSVLGLAHALGRLDPASLSVTVVASRRPEDVDGLDFQRSRTPRVPRYPDAMFAFQRPFTLRGYDVVHYIDSRPPLDYGLGRGLKVVTQHGFAGLLFDEAYIRPRHRRVDRMLARVAPNADLTLTASESERRELLRLVEPLDPERVVAIHHGIDHGRFRPGHRGRAGVAVAETYGVAGRYVLYVSNHQRKKNPERLLRAFAVVAEEEPDVTLVMTGRHSRRFHVVEDLIAELGLEPRVRVLGHVPDAALPDLYRAANVFALPSLHEGFGIPPLEAMACATPVVASDVYAITEVCGGAAVLVDPYDVEAIAGGLLRVLRDPALADELRQQGLARAARFTWQRSAHRHAAAYRAALA